VDPDPGAGDWFRNAAEALRRSREDDRRDLGGDDDRRWIPLALLAVIATVAAIAGMLWLVGRLTG
jgi:hypothetical protein